jgi:hypothetical protein
VLLGTATAAGLVALAVVAAVGPAGRAGRQDPATVLAEARRHPRAEG